MGFAEKRGNYWRGRFKTAPGKYGTVSDQVGDVIKFDTKRDAKRAADLAEANAAKQAPRPRADLRITFGEYVRSWYARQDLAASTMQNYRRHIENHLLPAFEETPLVELVSEGVDLWEKKERAAGYAASSIKTWRSTLHLILSDAEAEGRMSSNPATKRRGRGRRAGRRRNRGPEKVFTDMRGVLLIAERAAMLSGRDDEFVAVVTKGTTGMRFGELVGLETEYVRRNSIRVEWQLYELDSGELTRVPPKDDSYRTIDAPDFLSDLLTAHIVATKPKPCACHGRTYLFSGHRPANGAASAPGPKLLDVARLAEVSTGTVSNVLNRPEMVPEGTRAKVADAVAQLGYVRGGPKPGQLAPHWRRSGFATWLFHPAASGWYPRAAPQPARPVPILGGTFPGVPARGRGAVSRADACWTSIATGLTPHGLRHSHKTMMEEMGVPKKLQDDRMGHADGSVQARYSHITAAMRQRLMDDLTAQWETALRARRAMSSGSPVRALDALLRAV
ncbi:LacI family DNA-binding transcriptional regulator [Actinoplanes sp. NPDC049265]|uniref:tyrosine-type recombinase/integrase n=1 Tax=Actinoplanes sp. NPDC049265 TaxID=3363902 RepID=UPI00371D8C80